MTPAGRIVSDTRRRLGQADLLEARLGEETLTDPLVLDMLPHRGMNAFSIQSILGICRREIGLLEARMCLTGNALGYVFSHLTACFVSSPVAGTASVDQAFTPA